MKYTYRLLNDSEGVTATCVEVPVSVVAPDASTAMAELHKAICEHLTHIEAVAPPTSVPVPSVQLEPAREATPEPQGPGDSPAADRV
jgi:hypothetical protein